MSGLSGLRRLSGFRRLRRLRRQCGLSHRLLGFLRLRLRHSLCALLSDLRQEIRRRAIARRELRLRLLRSPRTLLRHQQRRLRRRRRRFPLRRQRSLRNRRRRLLFDGLIGLRNGRSAGLLFDGLIGRRNGRSAGLLFLGGLIGVDRAFQAAGVAAAETQAAGGFVRVGGERRKLVLVEGAGRGQADARLQNRAPGKCGKNRRRFIRWSGGARHRGTMMNLDGGFGNGRHKLLLQYGSLGYRQRSTTYIQFWNKGKHIKLRNRDLVTVDTVRLFRQRKKVEGGGNRLFWL